jgi:hypothetical protein
VTAQLRVGNNGDVVDELRVEVLGRPAAWASVDPPAIPLFPGQEDVLHVRFAPPRAAAVPAGDLPFGLKVASREEPAATVVEEGTVRVGRFDDLSAEIVPRTSRGRRGARHELALDNRGNARFNGQVTASDPDGALDFRMEPPSLVADAGTATFTRVQVMPRERFLRGPARSHPFKVVVQEPGALPVELQATMVQEGLIPPWVPKMLLLVLLGGAALAGLWTFLLRPTIESTATEVAVEAVDEQVDTKIAEEVQPAVDAAIAEGVQAEVDQAVAAQVAPQIAQAQAQASEAAERVARVEEVTGTTEVPDGQQRRSFDLRLAVVDRMGNTTATRTVHEFSDNQTFELTDVMYENPTGASGTLRILRNDDVLRETALENIRDYDDHWQSAPPFSADDTLAIEVLCTETPDPAGNCSAAVHFAGQLTEPAPEGQPVATVGG